MPEPLRDFPLTTGTGSFVPASNAFGFRLLQKLIARENPGTETNLFISPISLSLALTMTMDGADGEIRRAMQSALGYRAVDNASAIDSDARALLSRYNGNRISPDVELRIANALWPNLALPSEEGRLSPAFVARMAQSFGAAVEAVDFSRASGAQRVNAWTAEHTKGKIPQILPNGPLGASTALVLTNAVYFKARWNPRFDPAATKPGVFKLADGQKKTVPLMSRVADLPYLKGDGFQAVQMPYDDGRFGLYIALPDTGINSRQIATRCLSSIAQWNYYLSRFGNAKIALQLPRFKIAYDSGNLKELLISMGMKAAFERGPGFRPMGYLEAGIDAVLHKTTLVVDEAGSEATAVTAVRVFSAATSHESPPVIIPFIVDRPFFCSIRDNATGALLFLGRITDPDIS